ncbi:hypothetical protein [Flagellimonas baculiformis]|uniref:hypothetical protein n=1 Tax=Flagellimonas baculiformis TaxID=3067310 RepID=UPI00296F6CED|nr:hypothetical protein [Muricauda sp. D6]
MNGLLKKITLKKEFLFDGSIEELNEKLRIQNNQKFRVKWIDYKSFKFLAKFSIGTLIFRYTPSIIEGIKGYADLDEMETGKVKVTLSTKVRIELYIFLVIIIVGFIAALFVNKNIPIGLSLFTPIVLIWFWFVYRVQEKILFKKVETYLCQ